MASGALNLSSWSPEWLREPRIAAGALEWAQDDPRMAQNGPRSPNGAPANETLNKKVAIWGPSPASAPANKIPNQKVTLSGPSPDWPILALLLISF